jgi:hypothetical protein
MILTELRSINGRSKPAGKFLEEMSIGDPPRGREAAGAPVLSTR